MKIRWNIGTGYIMRIPDWELEIPDEDVEGLDEQDLWKLIDEYVEEEFKQECTLDWEIIEEKNNENC